MLFAFSYFRFRWPSEASRWLQDGPREPQRGPKRAPRRPQEGSRALQERLKRGPKGDFRHSRGARLIEAPPFFDRCPPRWPQDAKIHPKPNENQCLWLSRRFASDGLHRTQDSSKRAQEGPKRGPREPQDGPKSAQERSKSASRGTQEAIRGILEGQR